MLRDAIREWLSEHPKVLTALFVGSVYASKAIEVGTMGGAEGYAGP